MKLAAEEEREGSEGKYFSEGMRQIPRMRDHLTQPNQLDGSLSARRPKKETEKSIAPLTTITPVSCDSSMNSSKFPSTMSTENCCVVIHYIHTTSKSVINSAIAPPSLISCCRNNTAAHRSQRTPHPPLTPFACLVGPEYKPTSRHTISPPSGFFR